MEAQQSVDLLSISKDCDSVLEGLSLPEELIFPVATTSRVSEKGKKRRRCNKNSIKKKKCAEPFGTLILSSQDSAASRDVISRSPDNFISRALKVSSNQPFLNDGIRSLSQSKSFAPKKPSPEDIDVTESANIFPEFSVINSPVTLASTTDQVLYCLCCKRNFCNKRLHAVSHHVLKEQSFIGSSNIYFTPNSNILFTKLNSPNSETLCHECLLEEYDCPTARRYPMCSIVSQKNDSSPYFIVDPNYVLDESARLDSMCMNAFSQTMPVMRRSVLRRKVSNCSHLPAVAHRTPPFDASYISSKNLSDPKELKHTKMFVRALHKNPDDYSSTVCSNDRNTQSVAAAQISLSNGKDQEISKVTGVINAHRLIIRAPETARSVMKPLATSPRKCLPLCGKNDGFLITSCFRNCSSCNSGVYNHNFTKSSLVGPSLSVYNPVIGNRPLTVTFFPPVLEIPDAKLPQNKFHSFSVVPTNGQQNTVSARGPLEMLHQDQLAISSVRPQALSAADSVTFGRAEEGHQDILTLDPPGAPRKIKIMKLGPESSLKCVRSLNRCTEDKSLQELEEIW